MVLAIEEDAQEMDDALADMQMSLLLKPSQQVSQLTNDVKDHPLACYALDVQAFATTAALSI